MESNGVEDIDRNEIVCRSVNDLFDVLRLSKVEIWGDLLESPWIFRGHRNSNWNLTPRLWRPECYNPFIGRLGLLHNVIESQVAKIIQRHIILRGSEVERIKRYCLIRALELLLLRHFLRVGHDVGLLDKRDTFVDVVNAISDGFSKLTEVASDEIRQMAIAQHHRLPTRLLDWTKDPTKALVFALSTAGSEGSIAIWALDTGNLDIAQSQLGNSLYPKISIIEPDRTTTTYIHAQDACFTMFSNVERYFLQNNEFPSIDTAELLPLWGPLTLKKVIFQFDQASKNDAIARLWRERKTIAHLMPSLDHCSEFVKQYWTA